jgi:hypothetical protein
MCWPDENFQFSSVAFTVSILMPWLGRGSVGDTRALCKCFRAFYLSLSGSTSYFEKGLLEINWPTVITWTMNSFIKKLSWLHGVISAGERCPFEDGSARGCFLGLSTGTTRSHMFRAVSVLFPPVGFSSYTISVRGAMEAWCSWIYFDMSFEMWTGSDHFRSRHMEFTLICVILILAGHGRGCFCNAF